MLIEFILLMIAGLVLLAAGVLIRKKEQKTPVHDYHYEKAPDRSQGAYSALVSKGILTIGAGMIFSGILNMITDTRYGYLALAAAFPAGLGFMIHAELKYKK